MKRGGGILVGVAVKSNNNCWFISFVFRLLIFLSYYCFFFSFLVLLFFLVVLSFQSSQNTHSFYILPFIYLLILFSSLVPFHSLAITKLGFDPERKREKDIKFKEEQRLIFHRNPNFLFLVLLGFCDLWGFVKRWLESLDLWSVFVDGERGLFRGRE